MQTEPTYYIEGLFRQASAAYARAYLGITEGAGSGDVTHSVGPLTLDELVVGNALGDIKTFLSPGDGSLFLSGTTPPSWADPAGGMAWGRFRFDTSTVAADPGSGRLRLNTGLWATATQIFISDHSDPGTDVTSFFAMLEIGDQFAIQDRNDATKYGRYTVTNLPTDNGTWWTIDVSVVNSGGAVPANNQSIGVVLFYSGAAGGSGTVTNANNLTDNAVVVGDGGTVGVKTLAALGASGTVLTSNGAGVPPSFQAAAGTGNVTTAVTLTDHGVIVGNAGVDVIVTAVGATNTLLHGNTGADPTFSAVVEADITLANNTTNDVSTARHGFAPILPNNADLFFNGVGGFTTPPGLDFFFDYMEASILPIGATASFAYNCGRTESGTAAVVNPTATEPPGVSLTTGASNGNLVMLNTSNVGQFIYNRPIDFHSTVSTGGVITSYRMWGAALTAANSLTGSDLAATVFCGFRFSTGAGDANWMCVFNDNAGNSEALSSGVPVVASTIYRFRITWDGTTTGKVNYYINSALVQTSTFDFPTLSRFMMMTSLTTLTNATRIMTNYGIKIRQYYP